MLKEIKKSVKSVALTFKLSPDELIKFKRIAHKYTDGNTSLLIRHAVLNFKPDKGEE